MGGRFAETVAGSTSRSSQETNAQQKGHAMRSITLVTLTTLAIASILGTAGTSHAATWGGFAFAPGTPRIVTLINQASAGASNATSYLRVVRCTGVIDYPVFTWLGATCTAVTPDYTISMTVLSATKTNVKIVANSTTCGMSQSIDVAGFSIDQKAPTLSRAAHSWSVMSKNSVPRSTFS